jgi:hypothetical protein
VRATGGLAVRETITTPSGKTVLDFGQNLVGRLRIRLSGRRGATVTIRHAEVREDGELAVRLLRTAGPPTVTRCAATAPAGSGSRSSPCTDDLLTRLHDNVVWGIRGNFVDAPAGCRQRDERPGWTGDLQVFAPTAAYLYDCAGFLASWLKDLAPGGGDLRVEHLTGPLGLGSRRPRLSWRLPPGSAAQRAYRVRLASGAGSAWVSSGDSVLVDWPFAPLASLARVTWQVQVGPLTSAAAAHESPYGRVESSWTADRCLLRLDVTVRPGTTAEVVLPGRPARRAWPGRHSFEARAAS